VDALAQDAVADRLAGGEADARAEAAADDEHQHTAERAGDRARDAEVIEERRGRRGADDDAEEESDVLRGRQPETAAEAVGDADEGGGENDQIDQVWTYA
jgi:hypothetical protein